MMVIRLVASIRKEDDRRLEALARVDGEDAYALPLGLHVALDCCVGRLDLVEKVVQRRRAALFVDKRQRQELVDWIGSVVPKPPNQRASAAVFAQEPRVEGVRRKRLRAYAPQFQP